MKHCKSFCSQIFNHQLLLPMEKHAQFFLKNVGLPFSLFDLFECCLGQVNCNKTFEMFQHYQQLNVCCNVHFGANHTNVNTPVNMIYDITVSVDRSSKNVDFWG